MKTKQIVSSALVIAAIVAMVQAQTASAQQNGFRDGRAQANADWRAGGSYDDSCSIDFSHGYCISYKVGYSAEWNALKYLH